MKTASAELIALLATRSFSMADLYTFTTVDGTVLRYTTADVDITSGGHVFSSVGPRIERSSASWKVGLEVDDFGIEIKPRSTDLVGSTPWLASLAAGKCDGAEVQIERAFMATPGDDPVGTIVIFAGRVADVQAGRSSASIQVKSHLELLNTKLPRNVYQASCLNTLFDSGCGLNKATWESGATVQAGATRSLIPTNSSTPGGYYTLGTVLFNNGPCAGITRTIKRWASGAIHLLIPLPEAPVAGNTVTLAPGCTKTLATCDSKFNNKARFRGFPYIPVPETAI